MADETLPPLPPTPAATAATSRTEPLAIWSLIRSAISFFGCLFLSAIPGIIFGHLARSRIRKSNGALTGKELALVGLIIGYLQIPFSVLGGIMLVDMIRAERVRLHELALEKKEIASDDNKLKVTASGFWVKRTDLNKGASLQCGDKTKDLYLIVISDAKSETGKMDLQQHHQTTRRRMLEKMSNSSATDPVSVTIDGRPALQDELSGNEQGKTVTFLHTTLDDGDNFDQILAWTTKSKWAAHNSELREITNSFFELRNNLSISGVETERCVLATT